MLGKRKTKQILMDLSAKKRNLKLMTPVLSPKDKIASSETYERLCSLLIIRYVSEGGNIYNKTLN